MLAALVLTGFGAGSGLSYAATRLPRHSSRLEWVGGTVLTVSLVLLGSGLSGALAV